MKIPKKVKPVPKIFYNTPCVIMLRGERDRYGKYEERELYLMCRLRTREKRIYSYTNDHYGTGLPVKDRLFEAEENIALIGGESGLNGVTDCLFIAEGERYRIKECRKIINPDGSVHHYKLVLAK